jgi:tRNA synthetases class II (D, K and N)
LQGGWGFGIDRFTMMLTDKNNIKEVRFLTVYINKIANLELLRCFQENASLKHANILQKFPRMLALTLYPLAQYIPGAPFPCDEA